MVGVNRELEERLNRVAYRESGSDEAGSGESLALQGRVLSEVIERAADQIPEDAPADELDGYELEFERLMSIARDEARRLGIGPTDDEAMDAALLKFCPVFPFCGPKR
jgi:hypothetical protein